MNLFKYIKRQAEARRTRLQATKATLLILNNEPMKTLITRLTNESPSFFKKITNIGLTVGAIGAAIVAIPSSIVALPASVIAMGGYFIAVGAVAAAVAKTTVKDPSVLEDK